MTSTHTHTLPRIWPKMAERIKRCKDCGHGVPVETNEKVNDALGFPTRVPPGATRQRTCLTELDALGSLEPPEEFVSEKAKCIRPEKYGSWK